MSDSSRNRLWKAHFAIRIGRPACIHIVAKSLKDAVQKAEQWAMETYDGASDGLVDSSQCLIGIELVDVIIVE
jgi:hypothetical protein